MEEFRRLIHEGEVLYLKEHRVVFPGTHRVLDTLKKRGYRMAVVSNCHTPYLHAVMETQNLARHFEIISCIGDRPGLTKTSLVKEAVSQLGGEAAVIGDRYYDIDAAIANNLPSVGALYGYGSREELSESSTWVSDIRELLHLFHPLREAAARIASRANERRSIHRPITVALVAPHVAMTRELGLLLATELSSLNAPVVQIDLGDDIKLVRWVNDNVVSASKSGRVDTKFPNDERPIRSRPGGVVLVYGIQTGASMNRPDLLAIVTGNGASIRRAIHREAARLVDVEMTRETLKRRDARSRKQQLEREMLSKLELETPRKSLVTGADFILDGSRLDRGIFLEA
jgi:hypothetical protein